MEKKKEGGQPGNKNAEKWTEAEALKIGHELLEWLKIPENIFLKEFLIIENDYYKELIDYLCNKFKSFFNLYKKAEEIQEYKLASQGAKGKLNPPMTIFILKNKHNWADRTEVETTDKTPAKTKAEILDELERIRAARTGTSS